MPESIRTRDANSAPAPSPETRRLGALVGRWHSEGRLVGDPPVPIAGTDTCGRLPGGYFLVHHVDVAPVAQPSDADEGGAVRSTLTVSPTAAAWRPGGSGATTAPAGSRGWT